MPNVDSTVMTPRGTEQEGLVRGHLEELLASEEFQRSPQLAGFLRYVVTEALAGRSDRLKGYNVAVSALGRDEDFDPGSDPIVRITAGRLRRALERHYLGGGADSAVQIRIPKGGYVPEFRVPRSCCGVGIEHRGGETHRYLSLPQTIFGRASRCFRSRYWETTRPRRSSLMASPRSSSFR